MFEEQGFNRALSYILLTTTHLYSDRRLSGLLDSGATLVGPLREFKFDLEFRLVDVLVLHVQFDLPERERQFPVVVDDRQLVVVTELFAKRDQELTRLPRVQSIRLFEVPSRSNCRSFVVVAIFSGSNSWTYSLGLSTPRLRWFTHLSCPPGQMIADRSLTVRQQPVETRYRRQDRVRNWELLIEKRQERTVFETDLRIPTRRRTDRLLPGEKSLITSFSVGR